jgi:hypothetical protein
LQRFYHLYSAYAQRRRNSAAFALVRIWSVLARMLVPLFTVAGDRQARTIYPQLAGKAGETSRTSNWT